MCLFLVVLAIQYVAAVPASFNQTLAVSTNTTLYSFFAIGPIQPLNLLVSSASAGAGSSVVINSFTNTPLAGIPISASGSVVVNNGLPAGYAAFSAPGFSAVGAGLIINMTADIDGRANALLVISPTVLAQVNASLFASFRPLTFDASTQSYIELPANQYNASASGGIQIYTTRSVVLVFSVRNTADIFINITNSAIAYANLVANTTTTFAFYEGTRVAFTLYNITAAAGTFAIRASSNAVNTAGNIVISSVYSLNHSAGANAQVNAQFRYDTAQSSVSLNAGIIANSAWYVYNGTWIRQSSSVSSGVVIYNSNHFSDWSVQSTGNSSSSTTTTSGGSGGSSTTGASSKMSSVFTTLLKALF